MRKRRKRRRKAEMEAIRQAMYALLEEQQPMTVRQVFYALTTQGIIAKTEPEYSQTVVRLLGEMRKAKVIPYSWIADSTRWVRRARTHNSMKEALLDTARAYRRSLWTHSDVHIEIWLEKEALAGVIGQETRPWDISLYVNKGYASLSYLHNAAEEIVGLIQQGKHCFLYNFGDHDPSGVDAWKRTVKTIWGFVSEEIPAHQAASYLTFERVAVLPEQIERWQLPTRLTKKSDSRSKSFKGRSVELDAIGPQKLRSLVRDCIERHVDWHALEKIRTIEEQERITLESITWNLDGWQPETVN